jgi:hypothetical protein
MSHSIAILNTGKTMNPDTGQGEYADTSQIAYIVRAIKSGVPSGAYKVWTSYTTTYTSEFQLGQRLVAHADQSGRDLGDFILEGWVARDSHGNVVRSGYVPSRKLSHHVFK